MSTDKFDRQIRLWGPHGQRAIANANVLILGSGSIASEIGKNLTLGGIGSITFVDHALIT